VQSNSGVTITALVNPEQVDDNVVASCYLRRIVFLAACCWYTFTYVRSCYFVYCSTPNGAIIGRYLVVVRADIACIQSRLQTSLNLKVGRLTGLALMVSCPYM